jgi:hypothetical protein
MVRRHLVLRRASCSTPPLGASSQAVALNPETANEQRRREDARLGQRALRVKPSARRLHPQGASCFPSEPMLLCNAVNPNPPAPRGFPRHATAPTQRRRERGGTPSRAASRRARLSAFLRVLCVAAFGVQEICQRRQPRSGLVAASPRCAFAPSLLIPTAESRLKVVFAREIVSTKTTAQDVRPWKPVSSAVREKKL